MTAKELAQHVYYEHHCIYYNTNKMILRFNNVLVTNFTQMFFSNNSAVPTKFYYQDKAMPALFTMDY